IRTWALSVAAAVNAGTSPPIPCPVSASIFRACWRGLGGGRLPEQSLAQQIRHFTAVGDSAADGGHGPGRARPRCSVALPLAESADAARPLCKGVQRDRLAPATLGDSAAMILVVGVV